MCDKTKPIVHNRDSVCMSYIYKGSKGFMLSWHHFIVWLVFISIQQLGAVVLHHCKYWLLALLCMESNGRTGCIGEWWHSSSLFSAGCEGSGGEVG